MAEGLSFTVAWGNAPGIDVRTDALGRRPCSPYTLIPDVLFVILDVVALEKLAELFVLKIKCTYSFVSDCGIVVS